MNDMDAQMWRRFQERCTDFPEIGLAVDLSRMNYTEQFVDSMKPRFKYAFAEMVKLEAGFKSNPDEDRMVGHYWLRNPALAPNPEIRKEIEAALGLVKDFARLVHTGAVRGAAGPFQNLLLIGIGGSALGPQFVANALGRPASDKLTPYFFDNTDPDGMDNVLAQIRPHLGQTLAVVVSKSGETKETRNGMVEAAHAYAKAGLRFADHAVAITGADSQLDKTAVQDRWLKRFPMWDWVGGRTSELAAVGLLPAALQGLDIDRILAGAKATDDLTRRSCLKTNPAAQLALAWFYSGNGKGDKNMVVLPYKDRLELFSKYLQQLIMESLGKALNLRGVKVNQGITVFGNKGATDQHSYIQQLRDGLANFFVTFIEVLRDRDGVSMAVEPGVTSGDFLSGFFLGTRQALYEGGRESVTLTVNEVTPFAVGSLIALFERAVGLYASLIDINAYHQPGVQAGKKAAGNVIDLQHRVVEHLGKHPGGGTAEEIGAAVPGGSDVETVYKICRHLSANPDSGVEKREGATPFSAQFRLRSGSK